MSFEAFPNELLYPILNHRDIPLQERFQLRAVSLRWLEVIEDGFKKNGLAKLVLRDNRDGAGPTAFKNSNDLVVSDPKCFNDNLFQLLARQFPSISELTVDISSNEYFRNLPKLLSTFDNTLKSFFLHGKYSYNEDTNGLLPHEDENYNWYKRTKTSIQIAVAINSLVSLTSLELFALDLSARLVFYLAPTLARLEHFSLNDPRMNEMIYDNFTFLSQEKRQPLTDVITASLSNRCTYLLLHQDDFDLTNTKVDASLTHLHLVYVTYEELDVISDKLRSLESLILDFSTGTKWDSNIYLNTVMFRNLSHLNRLSELRLDSLHYEKSAINLPSVNDQPLVNIKLLCLEKLEIEACVLNGKYFCKMLNLWFPNLETLTIDCRKKCHCDTIKQNLTVFPSTTTVLIK